MKPENVNSVFVEADSEFSASYQSKRHDLCGRSYRSYVSSLSHSDDKYDLIIIDERCRHECIALAPRYLKPGDAILVDNTDMRRYSDLRPIGAMNSIVTADLTPC